MNVKLTCEQVDRLLRDRKVAVEFEHGRVLHEIVLELPPAGAAIERAARDAVRELERLFDALDSSRPESIKLRADARRVVDSLKAGLSGTTTVRLSPDELAAAVGWLLGLPVVPGAVAGAAEVAVVVEGGPGGKVTPAELAEYLGRQEG